MRFRPFYLTKRKLKSGRHVWYVYFRSEDGNRTVPESTGFSKKTDAINYATQKAKELQDRKDTSQVFGTYAKDWFSKSNRWYRERSITKKIKENSILAFSRSLNNHVMPFFRQIKVCDIKALHIKNFRQSLLSQGLSNSTVSSAIGVLRIILKWAISDGILKTSPFDATVSMVQIQPTREAFTLEEVKSILKVLSSNQRLYLIALTASVTGMRLGETVGLKVSSLSDGYILLKEQYTDAQGFTSLKNGKPRYVTMPKRLEQMLIGFAGDNDVIFSRRHDGTTPVAATSVTSLFSKSILQSIRDNHDGKSLSFHSLRHFFNTYMRAIGVQESKINAVVGHSDGGAMMNLYTSWRPELLKEVLDAQEKLFDLLTSSST